LAKRIWDAKDLEATARFKPRVVGIDGAMKQAELRLPPV
jgi:hypothetical protein